MVREATDKGCIRDDKILESLKSQNNILHLLAITIMIFISFIVIIINIIELVSISIIVMFIVVTIIEPAMLPSNVNF